MACPFGCRPACCAGPGAGGLWWGRKRTPTPCNWFGRYRPSDPRHPSCSPRRPCRRRSPCPDLGQSPEERRSAAEFPAGFEACSAPQCSAPAPSDLPRCRHLPDSAHRSPRRFPPSNHSRRPLTRCLPCCRRSSRRACLAAGPETGLGTDPARLASPEKGLSPAQRQRASQGRPACREFPAAATAPFRRVPRPAASHSPGRPAGSAARPGRFLRRCRLRSAGAGSSRSAAPGPRWPFPPAPVAR